MIQEDLVFFAALQIKRPLLFVFEVTGSRLLPPPPPTHTPYSHSNRSFSVSAVAIRSIVIPPLQLHALTVTLAGVSWGLAGLASRPLVCLSFFCSSTHISFLPRSSSISFLVLPFIARFPLPSPRPPSPSLALLFPLRRRFISLLPSPLHLLPWQSAQGLVMRLSGSEAKKKNHIKNNFFIKKTKTWFPLLEAPTGRI